MYKTTRNCFLVVMVCLLAACSDPNNNGNKIKEEVQQYLNGYNDTMQQLFTASSETQWLLNTHIVEGDTMAAYNANQASEAYSRFSGSAFNINKATEYLKHKDELGDLEVRQLKAILYSAASGPMVIEDVVKALIKAGNEQTENLFGYDFKIAGKSVSTNHIDDILSSSVNLDERLKAWEASKEVGKGLKSGLANLQQLRNRSVQELGYNDYFAYQVSDYGMTSDEMMKTCRDMIKEIWPLYRELHTWARYELAKKYNQQVPDMLPAHWLPNRWGQEWGDMVTVQGLDVDAALKTKTPEWIIKQSENFYVSIGFDSLPKSFWEKSSLYPLALDAGYKKNNHASAWHMNRQNDVRSLMSIEANARWWETALHELGHIYYYNSYSNAEVPIILREGANRGFHEAFGTMMGLASMQKPFLENFGLVDPEAKIDETQALLKEALNYIVLIPWGAGVMTGFEYELYSKNLPLDQYNKKWWELVQKYQGIVPPSQRGEEFCDAASKTHINDDAAQYYDYAISNILLFQFHDHIAKNILHQNPHSTNYYGNKEVGEFLKQVMSPGQTGDWSELLKKELGTDMSAKSMVDYFAPLMAYLKEQNKGRKYTLPEEI
jgi:peptidyl-dipeptidase A